MRLRWIAVALLLVSLLPTGSAQSGPLLLPEQVHVTVSDSRGLVVQWAVVGSPYAVQDLPFVEWRSGSGSLSYSPAVLSGVVVPATAAGSAATPTTAYHYAANVDVPLGAEITYRVGAELRGMAGPFTVRNVPGLGESLRFVAYGDIGVDTTGPDGSVSPGVVTEPPSVRTEGFAHTIRDLALEQNPQLWTIAGDLSYDNSGLGWSKFLRFAQPLQATVPTMPAMGNHEFDSDNGLGYSQFLNAYVLPGDEQNFLFRAGPMTFIVINSDGICGPGKAAGGSPQEPCYGVPGKPPVVSWLEAALQEASTDLEPWTVVMFHHPVWSWGRHGGSAALQSLFAPLFEKYSVDAVINAHDHLYSRTYPLVGQTVTGAGAEYSKGAGPVYIVLGGGGRALYDLPPDPRPDWVAAAEKIHHLSVWNVNATELAVTVLRIDGSELDSFRIVPGISPTTDGAAPIPAPWWIIALGLVGVALFTRRGTRSP